MYISASLYMHKLAKKVVGGIPGVLCFHIGRIRNGDIIAAGLQASVTSLSMIYTRLSRGSGHLSVKILTLCDGQGGILPKVCI